MFHVKHEPVSLCLKICIVLVVFSPQLPRAEKFVPSSFNQSYHNHRTGSATNIPWNVLFDPSYSGVAKVDGDALKSTTDSSVSVFYGHSAYSPSSYGQSSQKKSGYAYKSLVSTTTRPPITTSSPYKSPVVVAYSSPDEEIKSSVNFPNPTYNQPVYPDQDTESNNNQVESRLQAPVYREGSYSRPYYPEYNSDDDKRPVYSENPYRKKKPVNDRRPQEFYNKNKPSNYNEPDDPSDDPFETDESFDDLYAKKPISPSYKKGKDRLKKPDRYQPSYHVSKPEYSSESKHHPFYNYDYYGDYYDHGGPPVHFKHKVYSKKKSKYAPLALALGLLPLGLMLAAIVPSVMTIPATVTTAAGRKKRSILDQKYSNPVLDAVTTYGVRNLDDPMCLQRIFCQVTNEGKNEKSNFFQKIFYGITKLIDEGWAEKFGMKLLVRAIKRDKCELFPCPPKEKKDP
ncbi:uncharacterized protein [Centruroides vittatus]|uniref:uncharacterized protein n=1 Tax=Centruroides vittatus TaxID=120091 RepID=UPI00350E9EE0